jgi:NADPH-dependent glutamate synthase beta subunit-like oxidoreductase/2,4-dienoyl-CoA reductase-like NADH-dependent reductase (Old Yellow Enzyme family)
MEYQNLFLPITIGSCTFPNRILSTSMVTRLTSEDGHITDMFRERYQRMAKGGLGAMVVEAAVVLPSRSSFNLRISDDQFIPEFKKFVQDINNSNPDVKIGLQLIHFLKLSRSGWRQKVEDLKLEEIGVIPEQFASGALRARTAGFDFVEIHMAHFTTLASFLSLVNKRGDDYGGDFEGRMKLPSEVISKVRNTVGSDFPVGIRMNGEEYIKEGNTLLQSTRVARRLAKLGIDYISVSAGERHEDAEPPPPNFPPFAGTGYSGYRMSPRWWNPDGCQVFLCEGIRKALIEAGLNVPVITAGKIRTPDLAEKILAEGKADIIGMARTLLCDPDWPNKSYQGREDTIVKCAACGYCSEADEKYETIICIQWPKGMTNAPSPWLLNPPCKAACPAGLEIRDYIDLITQGHYEDALRLIKKKIPLPATISRVCPHPCEAKCNRGTVDEPIAINALKRFLVDTVGLEEDTNIESSASSTKTDRVAIIGSGPAGLTAAYYLTKLGYGVTIFEALNVAGGMLSVGIPEYRLPRVILNKEIESIKRIGVEIKLNNPIGNSGMPIENIWQNGYKAIFVATGAHKSLKLYIPGEELLGVYHGINLLKEINLGNIFKPGEKVAIIGGGNVAIDIARTIIRLGAKEVTVIYRRSPREMPAHEGEVQAAEVEGVRFQYLTTPVKIIGKDNKVSKIECIRMELGEKDESGRRSPMPIKGSEYKIDVDNVILAIGEIPDLTFLEDKLDIKADKSLKIDYCTMMTNIKGIFAGGDAVSGPATVIEAIAAGRKAAISIDKYLRKQKHEFDEPVANIISFEDIDTSDIRKRKREKIPCMSPEERIRNFKEVELGLSELASLKEADRCLQCDMHPNKHKYEIL